MKRITLILIFLASSLFANAQDISVFNGYRYIYLPPLKYQNGGTDVYGISSEVRGYFQEKGFGILTDMSDPKKLFKEVRDNPCIVLTCNIQHPAPNSLYRTVVALRGVEQAGHADVPRVLDEMEPATFRSAAKHNSRAGGTLHDLDPRQRIERTRRPVRLSVSTKVRPATLARSRFGLPGFPQLRPNPKTARPPHPTRWQRPDDRA